MSKLKNKIVGYHGGGYDGCFWEPNFCYIDKAGIIHDLYSSGYAGMFKNGKQVKELKELDSMQTYSATQKGVNKMLKDYRQDFIVAIVKKLNKNFQHIELGVKCDKCGKIADPYEINFESYKGDGGIGIIHDGIICPDCHSAGSCQKCNEYASELNEYGLCDCCQSEIEKSIPQIEILKDIIKQGYDKLAEISKLNPKYAKKYSKQHQQGCEDIHKEIAELIQAEIDNI